MNQKVEPDRNDIRALIAANPDRLQDHPAAMRALARMRMAILIAMNGRDVPPAKDTETQGRAHMLAEAAKLRHRADELEMLALGEREKR